FLLLLSLLLPSLLIMFIPSTFKRPVSSWKELNLRNFFFQAEDGIRDKLVTGVQTCALPIYDLRSGDTLYLNADDSFHAASTMKRSEERRVGKEWTLQGTRALEQKMSLLLRSLRIMFMPLTLKGAVSSWKALNLR